MLTFSGLKPGDTVAELIPGGGYYTRLLAKTVGPSGKVYAMIPKGLADARPQMVEAVKSIPGVEVVVYPSMTPATPQKVDLVWTSENYHDFHNGPEGGPSPDIAGFNKAIAAMLKPGGAYLIEDHAAAAGAGTSVTNTLHRIEPAAVISEVTAAGFKLEAQSGVLKNDADPHTAPVFDPSVRGKTDKLLLKFRKVGK